MRAPIIFLTGCIVGCQSPLPVIEGSETLVFRCEEQRTLVLHRAPGQEHSLERVLGWFPEAGFRQLTQVESGSGLRYQGDDVEFWGEGDQADVAEGDAFYHCALDHAASIWEHAKLMGVQFRATGNEPGWTLELEPMANELRLLTDYGQRKVSLPLPTPSVDPAQRQSRYRAASSEGVVEVLIEGEECRDSMSGEHFESRVRVQFDGQLLEGCGRSLY